MARDCDRATGCKEYVACDNLAAYTDELRTTSADDHWYELIPIHRPVCPFFDLEWDAAELEDPAELLMAILTVVGLQLQRIGLTVIRGIAVYCASGACSTEKIRSGQKASYHVMMDTAELFSHMADHLRFMREYLLPALDADAELKQRMTWHTPQGRAQLALDTSVYKTNQVFRLPYQSKRGTARPLLPADILVGKGVPWSDRLTIGVYEPPDSLHTLLLPPPMTRGGALHGLTNPVIAKGVESPEYEKVHALCELLTPAFLEQYAETRNLIWLLWGVEQTPRMREQIHRICKKGHNYEASWVESVLRRFRYSGLHIGSLVVWASRCAGEPAVAAILSQFVPTPLQELFQMTLAPARHTTTHTRFLGDDTFVFDAGDDTLVVKSHLGTGKTRAILAALRGICGPAYDRVLILSARKSYTRAIRGELEADAALPAVQSYMDLTGPLSSVPYLVLQMESLHRIATGFEPYDLVVMDESESLLHQMHSVMTHGNHMIDNHTMLEKVVRTAGRVLMCDAFLTNRTFHFARELRMPSATRSLENTFQPYAREAIRLPTTSLRDGSWESQILAALGAGRRIVVVWTVRRAGLEFAEKHLAHGKISYRFYHSESSAEEQEELHHVEESWSAVQCLMMTTSITVGLSYSAEPMFDEAFLYASPRTALPRDVAQTLLRVRALRENRLTYVIGQSGGGLKETTATAATRFVHHAAAMTAKEEEVASYAPQVKWASAPDWARWNWCYSATEEDISRRQYQEVLEAYLTTSGYTVRGEAAANDTVANDPVANTIADEKAEAEAETKESAVPYEWTSLPVLMPSEAEEVRGLLARGVATSDQRWAYKKHVFTAQFVHGCTDEILAAAWVRYMTTDHADRFWNVVSDKRSTVVDLARGEARARFAFMATQRLKRRTTMGQFLGILGMTHGLQHVVIPPEHLAALTAPLATAEAAIRKGLGLRASRRRAAWKTETTIDFIRTVVEEWCGGRVECSVVQTRPNKKIVREYTLILNENDTIWDAIDLQKEVSSEEYSFCI